MSKTLYLLGYSTSKEGQPPVTDADRVNYGFPTEPKEIHDFAHLLFNSEDADVMLTGYDLGIAAVDILTRDRKPQLIAPDAIRPVTIDDEGHVLWEGFRSTFSRVARARGIQHISEMPDFRELCSAETDGVLLGAHVDLDSVGMLKAYSRPNIGNAPEEVRVYSQSNIAAFLVFENFSLNPLSPAEIA